MLRSPSCAFSPSCSNIVLEGDPGLGGVPDRDVAELRDERVKVFCGACFSGVEEVEVREDSLDSVGTRLLLFPDLVRFNLLPILVRKPGFSCDAGDPPLALLLTLRSSGGGFVSGGSSGVDLGIVEAIAAIFGVLTGRDRGGSCWPAPSPLDEDGGEGLVFWSTGGG